MLGASMKDIQVVEQSAPPLNRQYIPQVIQTMTDTLNESRQLAKEVRDDLVLMEEPTFQMRLASGPKHSVKQLQPELE